VIFINDRFPRATAKGRLQDEGYWELLPTTVERGATLGSGVVVAGGVCIGQGTLVGAGAVSRAASSPDRSLSEIQPDRSGHKSARPNAWIWEHVGVRPGAHNSMGR
jgi:acetyltransferase-like isoleucine patch superfamily enzyme